MIRANDICFSSILNHAAFLAPRGEITCIVGPNGAGKSTLLRLLAGLRSPDTGQVLFQDKDIARMSFRERARAIAYVPQRLEALPDLTVAEFVLQSTYAGEKNDSLTHTLGFLGMLEFAHRRLPTLSGGELQKAVLAAAVMQNTPVILLDEPTASLDIAQSLRIEGILRALANRGKTIILVTHDLPAVLRIADYTVLLCNGQTAYCGKGIPPRELLASCFGLNAAELPQSVSLPNAPAKDPTIEGTLDASAGVGRKSVTPVTPLGAVVISAGLFLLVLVGFSPFIGSQWIAPGELFVNGGEHTILLQMRIPRVLWSSVAGATLACVGAALQAMLQNPLATPYTLGIASGANLGALAAILLGMTSLWAIPGCALIGAMTTMACVLLVCTKARSTSTLLMVLAGVAASLFCGAAGLFVQALATPMTAQQMIRWQMGGFDILGYASMPLFVPILGCLAALRWLAMPLNLLSVDAELAQTRGVNTKNIYALTFLTSGIATACVTAVCGPVGFVGLLIPLWLRRRFGADLRILLPLCAIMGAAFILIADDIARMIEATIPIPAGVLVALFGVPAVIASFLLNKRSQISHP